MMRTLLTSLQKIAYSIYFVLLCALPAFAANSSATEAVMSPVRRVGIDVPKTNLTEFRSFMDQQGTSLKGFAAMPLDEWEAGNVVIQEIENAMKQNGRFWALSLSTYVGPKEQKSKQKDEIKQRLAKDFDLDAWLSVELTFEPERTLIRMKLVDNDKKHVVAREDVVSNAMASVADLKNAFGAGLTRMISTIGHDGKVTYARDGVVTLDFGKERGISVGSKLIAGFVVLTAQHPVTKEFLRVRKVVTHELEVQEVRQGSALCRITAIDRDALRNGLKNYQGADANATLLVWRSISLSNEDKQAWKDPLLQELSPSTGGTAEGFPQLEVVEEKKIRKDLQAPASVQPEPMPLPPPENDGDEAKTAENPHPVSPEEMESPRPWNQGAKIDQPETWQIHSAWAGGGISNGFLETADGSRNTGFPGSIILLNYFDAGADVNVHGPWNVAPQLSYAMYDQADVKGSLLRFRMPATTRVYSLGEGQYFNAGLGFEYSAGLAETVLVSERLDEIDVFAEGSYLHHEGSLGVFEGSVALPIIGLFSGHIGYHLQAKWEKVPMVPKNLGFKMSFAQGPHIWNEFVLGAYWNFATH